MWQWCLCFVSEYMSGTIMQALRVYGEEVQVKVLFYQLC